MKALRTYAFDVCMPSSPTPEDSHQLPEGLRGGWLFLQSKSAWFSQEGSVSCRGEGGQKTGMAHPCCCRSPGHTSLNLGQSGAAPVAIFVSQASLEPTLQDLGDSVPVFPLLLPNVTVVLRSPNVNNTLLGSRAGQIRGQF